MDGSAIIQLYRTRDEQANDQTAEKYGAYCRTICAAVSSDVQDMEESVNDIRVGAGNAMPPHRPSILSVFLGKIARRVSLKKWREQNDAKRYDRAEAPEKPGKGLGWCFCLCYKVFDIDFVGSGCSKSARDKKSGAASII